MRIAEREGKAASAEAETTEHSRVASSALFLGRLGLPLMVLDPHFGEPIEFV
jgi:hypothetical protein